ncbi:MAG: hypothetical protein R6U67_15310 [Sodalinema sp.]
MQKTSVISRIFERSPQNDHANAPNLQTLAAIAAQDNSETNCDTLWTD